MQIIARSTMHTPFGVTTPWENEHQHVGLFEGTGPDGETLRKYVSFTVPADASEETIERVKSESMAELERLGTDWHELPDSELDIDSVPADH